MNIVAEKLDSPIHAGDWHDPALRWVVKGPNDEKQHFTTKRDANLYKKCRVNSENQSNAIRAAYMAALKQPYFIADLPLGRNCLFVLM